MSKIKVGDKVYSVRNADYLLPYIQEHIVVKPPPKARRPSLIALAPPDHLDDSTFYEYKSKGDLAYTMAGAFLLLDKAIDERIRKHQSAIEKLRAVPAGNREAVNAERG